MCWDLTLSAVEGDRIDPFPHRFETEAARALLRQMFAGLLATTALVAS